MRDVFRLNSLGVGIQRSIVSANTAAQFDIHPRVGTALGQSGLHLGVRIGVASRTSSALHRRLRRFWTCPDDTRNPLGGLDADIERTRPQDRFDPFRSLTRFGFYDVVRA